MHTAAALLDLHDRTHRSLGAFIDHCAGFSAEDWARELEGFGYPTIALQLHHAVTAERYWVGVLKGEMLIDEHEKDYASVEALRAHRQQVIETTKAYLDGASDAELNTRREMTTWGPRQAELMPAQVLLRTQTHVFQHLGQVAAMSRLLGRPIPQGMDFPLGP